jgi:hypothetical protein
MSNGTEKTTGKSILQQFLTSSSFGTVASCAVITWLVAGVIGNVFSITHGALGLIVALLVAYARPLVGKREDRTGSAYILAFFNGFLIYATVVGGTSFMPYVVPGAPEPSAADAQMVRVAWARPWVSDPDLVERNRDLATGNEELSHTVEVQAQVLETTNRDLRVIREQVESGSFNPSFTLEAIESATESIESIKMPRRDEALTPLKERRR